MIFSLEFHEKALKEFRDLDQAVRTRLKTKLAERLENPHIPAASLRGKPNRYKVKLMKPAIRLVYEVKDETLVVCVLAVGERANSTAYTLAAGRDAP